MRKELKLLARLMLLLPVMIAVVLRGQTAFSLLCWVGVPPTQHKREKAVRPRETMIVGTGSLGARVYRSKQRTRNEIDKGNLAD